MWDEPACPLSQDYMNDMAKIKSVVSLAPGIQVPWLLVHGAADDVVPIQDSKDIFAVANRHTELFEIPGANHVFSGDYTTPMVQKVIAWLHSHVLASTHPPLM